MVRGSLVKLSQVIREELPESRVQKEMAELENDVARHKAYLMEVEPRNNTASTVKEAANQESQIRMWIYDAEDIIDSYKAQFAVHQFSSSVLPRSFNPVFISLMKQAKSLRANMINPRLRTDMIGTGEASTTTPEDQQTSKKKRINKAPAQDNVVGFEEETEFLVKNLLEQKWKLDVISITGMTGIGKTTLASKICHDRRIQMEFPEIFWFYVSQEFDKKDMFLTILQKFTDQDISHKTVEQLSQMVKKYLDKEKFLIFLDDICSVEVWEEIRVALPVHNGKGKVLITTSNMSVAQYESKSQIGGRIPFELQLLEENKGWELLQLLVYGSKLDHNLLRELKKAGKSIVKKCGRLPGALVVIGEILAKKVSTVSATEALEIWEDVSENVRSVLFDTKNPERKDTIITLCYNRLPHHLRDCFLYLGMFPENFEIPAWKLIQLWIAEGYINCGDGRTMEEIARENLMELIMRNLVEVGQQKANGYPKTCRVNNTVRDFCKNEAAFHRKNIFCEVTRPNNRTFQPPIKEMEKNRRLCIHSNICDLFSGKPNLPKTHSFLCFSEDRNETINSIADPFNMLRVLEAYTIRFPKFPAKLTHLVHLKYIALSSKTHVLPKAISKLWNLQTIIVNTSSPTLEIKADIWEMEQIRLVKTNAAIALNKNGKGSRGQNLQKLTRLSPESCTDQVFTRAKNLKTLGIRGSIAKLLDSSFLQKLESLVSLKLENTPSESVLEKLPAECAFPRNLKILTLSSTCLDWDHMSVLGDLLCLQELKLKDRAFMGDRWSTKEGGFNQLECLSIGRTNLKRWYASSKSFPVLRILLLENCKNLERVPLELENKLVKLEMRGVSQSAVSSGKEIEQAKLRKSGMDGFKLVVDDNVRNRLPKESKLFSHQGMSFAYSPYGF